MGLTKVTYSMINGAVVNVLDYGVKGDGATDDTAAIQAALNTGANAIFFPQGTYKVSGTLLPANNQTLYGVSREWGPGGSIITASSGLNVPLIKFTHGGTVKNLSLSGTATSAETAQSLIYINNTNGVTVDSVFLMGGYDLIKIDGESFFITLINNVFYSAYNTQLLVSSFTAAGVDMIMDNCRFLSLPNTASAAMSFYGLGSILCTNTQISVESVKAGGSIVYFDQPAANYGGAQFSNCVFENASAASDTYAVYVKGTSGLPWHSVMFNNCQMNGGNGVALRSDYSLLMEVIGGILSSVNANGAFYVPPYGNTNTFSFVGVDFEGNAGISPVQSTAPVTVSGSFTSCRWTGFAPFINYSTVTPTYLNVIGGYLGTASQTVLLANYENTIKNIQVINSNYGPLQYKIYTGTLDGSGAATIAHGISPHAQKNVIFSTAYYKGGSGEAVPMSVNYIDGVNIGIGGGGASANYRVAVQYVQQEVAW